MYSLVVLGQIPGTDIQISFTAWLLVGMLAVTLIAYAKLHRRNIHTLSFDPTIASDEQQAAIAR